VSVGLHGSWEFFGLLAGALFDKNKDMETDSAFSVDVGQLYPNIRSKAGKNEIEFRSFLSRLDHGLTRR